MNPTVVNINTYGNAVFAVIKSDRFLGICGGKLDADDPFHVEIIIHLAKEYWHQGYATEALKAYLAWLKAGKRAAYVYASVHPDNWASLNMVKKCGLVPCGFRQYEDTGFVDEPYFELNLDDIKCRTPARNSIAPPEQSRGGRG